MKAFDKVFGEVNVNATSRKAVNGIHKTMRVGKTARDKANGHVAGKKNRRIFDDKARIWVKV